MTDTIDTVVSDSGFPKTIVMSVDQFTEKYDLVTIARDENGLEKALVVVDKSHQLAEKTKPVGKPNYSEIGVTGSTSFGSAARLDYNSRLVGQQGLLQYDEMRKSSGQIKAGLLLVKTPVLAARWYVGPGHADEVEPDQIQIDQANFINSALFKWPSHSWSEFLREALLCLDFGHYLFEKVFTQRTVAGKTQVVWQKFAPRHPLDITQWIDDPNGGPSLVEVQTTFKKGPQKIPIDKLLVFTNEKEAGNMQGVSVLRSQYSHWFYANTLYKIDAIQKERHGIGIPVIKLPMNFDAKDQALAQEMGRNLRTNEKAYIVLPPNWEIMMLKLEGHPVDALASAKHHELMMARTSLGQFINSEIGLASVESAQTLFLKATRFVADILRDTINKYAIPQLIDFNFGPVEYYPELKVRRIGDTVDWRTISFAIRNFVGAGILRPDDRLEKWVRDEMDLPASDSSSVRLVVAPQQAGTIPDGKPDSQPGSGGAKAGLAKQNNGLGAAVTPPKPTGAGLPKVGPPNQAPLPKAGSGSIKSNNTGGGK